MLYAALLVYCIFLLAYSLANAPSVSNLRASRSLAVSLSEAQHSKIAALVVQS